MELAEIFRRYGAQYRAKYGEHMLPSHRQTMAAIERCRTEALGGQVYYCDHCDEARYCYHSCRNRHCPKCQNERAEQWLVRQQALLLPIEHFMVTFTLPAELRPLARSHQHLIYNALFRASAAALQALAADPRFVGGHLGMMGVLHTWGRDLSYHPHVHYLVPGGGLAPDGSRWHLARQGFLVHVKPLSRLFRAKFRAELRQTELFHLFPAKVWQQDWVVHCQPVGSGQTALKYLAAYVFRVAISNNRIVKVEDDRVTFRYRPSGRRQDKYCTLAVDEFIRRFLQHVLPKGFVKVRYYGLFSPAKRHLLHQVRLVLVSQPTLETTADPQPEPVAAAQPLSEPTCPHCGQKMRRLGRLKPQPHCRSP